MDARDDIMHECGIGEEYYSDNEATKKATVAHLNANLTSFAKRYFDQGHYGRYTLVLLVAIAMEMGVTIEDEVKKLTKSSLGCLTSDFQQEQMCFRLKHYKPGKVMPLAFCELLLEEELKEWSLKSNKEWQERKAKAASKD